MDFLVRHEPDGTPMPVTLWEAFREGHDDYRYVYTLEQLIAQAQTSGDADAAISDFSVIGNDNSVPAAVRDIARIRAGYLLVDHGSYDDVAAQVEGLTGPDNAMRHSAREALGLAAWKAGELTQAYDWFDQIVEIKLIVDSL